MNAPNVMPEIPGWKLTAVDVVTMVIAIIENILSIGSNYESK